MSTTQTAIKRTGIEAEELLRLETLLEMEKVLERRLNTAKADRRALEESLILRLEVGALLPVGFSVEVRAVERRYPHWRELFIERHGVAEAEAQLAATPTRITKRLHVKKAA